MGTPSLKNHIIIPLHDTAFCLVLFVLIISSILLISGCQKTYYNTMEKLGVHKRDIMVSRVKAAQDAQEEAKDQFKSALDKFSSVLKFDGGKLEEKYEELTTEYERSSKKAEEVRDRIDDVEDVSEALFSEWETELAQYTNKNLRRTSEQKLRKTQGQYKQLIRAMKRVEGKIDPVLNAFNDQVLFLKHNLNAQAVASLKTELVSVEEDVASLIKEMETSIREAETFISTISN
jgi:hypothetical protein